MRKVLVIFPFEVDFYRKHNVAVEYVGHPLADVPPPSITREQFAAEHHLDASKQWIAVLPGSRRKEVALNLPGIDPEAEARRINRIEIDTVDGVAAIAGADAFLRGLPADRWAVVTSAPRALALARIAAAGLPLPRVLIASEDVRKGKPDPEPFLRGAAALGVAPEDCLVFEDAPAGVAACNSPK